MKQKLAILWFLIACHGYAANECEVLAHDNPIHIEIIERMGTIEDKAPSRVEFCGKYRLYWKSYWDAFEMPDGWQKRAEGICWGRQKNGAMHLYNCIRSIYLANNQFDGEIRLAHDLKIKLVQELIAAAKQSIGPKDRITEIEYTPVRDGSAWTDIEYGYQVSTSNHPHHQSGKILHIFLTCGPEPCVWTVISGRIWAT